MDKSIFTEKAVIPTQKDLIAALDKTFDLWQSICDFTYQKYPAANAEWNYPGDKYGWSFRIKDKKRAILYLLPRDKFFRIAFVFGQKAFDTILSSSVADEIKNHLKEAKVFAEGRGIRLEIRTKKSLPDIYRLIEIKISN